jgi:hypothetical protein
MVTAAGRAATNCMVRAFRDNGFSSMQTFGTFDGAAFDRKESSRRDLRRQITAACVRTPR